MSYYGPFGAFALLQETRNILWATNAVQFPVIGLDIKGMLRRVPTCQITKMMLELDLSWAVFQSYAFYTSILVMKLISLSFMRAAIQYRKQVVFHSEDLTLLRKSRIATYDEDIMRTQKAQDDDLKTIIPFCILGLIYCFTHPSTQFARMIFRVFTAARFLHSFVYVIYIVRQPARAIAWSVGTIVNLYMSFKILFYFM